MKPYATIAHRALVFLLLALCALPAFAQTRA